MASVKFTREVIEVKVRDIIYSANQMLESLKDEDDFMALEGVVHLSESIDRDLDEITIRLKDCDEY